MVYLTGDIHGNERVPLRIIEQHGLTSSDILVLLGDVALNYFGNDHGDKKRKKHLNAAGVPVLCIHGNHEQRPFRIPSYHEIIWHGGQVYVENEFPNLLFAKDGEIYDLEGRKCIALGGAYSVDKYYRIANGMAWFMDEQPSAMIKQHAEAALNRAGWKVDVVLSHTCPLKYEPVEMFLPGIDHSKVDKSTEEWLDSIENRLDYQAWFCGHWHTDKRIDKMHFLMHSVEVLPGGEPYDRIFEGLVPES